MRTLLIVFLVVVCSTVRTFGCDCTPPPPPFEAAEEADVVFVGRVTSGSLDDYYGRQFEFSVEDVLKGEVESNVSVMTGVNAAICGYDFIIGRVYLVYAYFSKGNLFTHICTRTKAYLPFGKIEAEELKSKP